MPENPFVRMYRDLVRRINEMPQVRLSRADPEAPAEPAEGWALSVGRQRVALGAAAISLAKLTDGELSAGVRDSLRTQLAVPSPPADTDWTPLTLDAGFTGGVWWCVRGGVVYLHGRVTRDAGNWPTDFTPFATLPAAARPSYPSDAGATYHPLTALDGSPLTFATISDGTMSARAATGTSTTHIYLHSLSWPVTP